MINPWLQLSEIAPFVLEHDAPAIATFNHLAKPDLFIHLELLPEPFLGNPLAPVVLLGLNPGYSPDDITHHQREQFAAISRSNLHHRDIEYPFYLLNPALDAPGGKWWAQRLSRLIAAKGRKAVAQRVLCIEYFPYHSRRFAHAKLRVPSQDYSMQLLRNAIRRDAIIVIMRAEKLWLGSVPELAQAKYTYRLNSVQNTTISLNNCPNGYTHILDAL
jgi:hypothetical protein